MYGSIRQRYYLTDRPPPVSSGCIPNVGYHSECAPGSDTAVGSSIHGVPQHLGLEAGIVGHDGGGEMVVHALARREYHVQVGVIIRCNHLSIQYLPYVTKNKHKNTRNYKNVMQYSIYTCISYFEVQCIAREGPEFSIYGHNKDRYCI